MRNIFHLFLVAMALLSSSQAFAQRRSEEVPLDLAELEALRAAEARRAAAIAADVNRAGQLLALTFGNTFVLRRTTTDEGGTLHARYEQRYLGIRVHGGELIAHVSLDGDDRTLTPAVFPGIAISVRPAIALPEALALAERALFPGRIQLDPTNSSYELMIWPEQELIVRGEQAKGEAKYDWRPRRYRLVWQIQANSNGSNPRVILVDAHTGTVEHWDAADYDLQAAPIPANATARTLRWGSRGINTRQNAQTQLWELIDPTRGNSIVRNHNYSMQRLAAAGQLYTDNNNLWGDSKTYDAINGPTSDNGQTAAADAAFASRNTWDMLRFVFTRNGLDGKGTAMRAHVHYGQQFNDAFWVNGEGTAFFGDGPSLGNATTITSESIVGHEFGHGLWFYELGPDGGKGTESDGLNEGHGDIMGSLVEFYLRGGGTGSTLPEANSAWNWIGRMVDPQGYSEPLNDAQGNPIGTSFGYRYYDANIRNAAEHANGCLYGHFFVILARGASADPASTLYSKFRSQGTSGIGVMKAARIWYRATTAYLPPNPTYIDVRKAYMDAAAALYGKNSPEYTGVLEAWAAIGLSTQPKDKLTIQF